MPVLDKSSWARVKQVFDAAAELPPDRRSSFLDAACADDTRLRNEVASLLAAHDSTDDPSGSPTIGAQEIAARTLPDNHVGTLVGPYRLLEKIGEGGFGTVYMAEQCEPMQRRVALKIIKPGMDSKQVIARFEAERQALAMMDHPNIARVLDAGTTQEAICGTGFQPVISAGLPYFVMELVKGVPITQYCDDHRVALPERLALFTDVCYAVQHAHQKGIIHRDLKPSNVLVSRHDDRPVVKVIDFGIAKATGARLTDKSLHTEWRQLVGTPTYMSPEQAGMSDLDIDTRSDIYALGVLLYELLTGTTPFDTQALIRSGFDEMRRVIREVEPPKPSTRVSSFAARLPSDPPPARGESSAVESLPHMALRAGSSSAITIASARRTDPKLLSRQLRGDLDWIVMKCLEKDRTRRYETADALALEVKRYGKNEPVLAGPPSRVYRFRKFVRRNRGTVAAAAVVAIALLAGITGTTFGLLQADERRVQAEAAQVREREQRELAEKREKQTQQVSEFQGAMLGGIDVEAMGRGIKQRLRDQVRSGLEREYVGEFPNRRKRTPEEIEAELVAFDQRAAAAEGADVARGVIDEFVLARAAVALEKEFADQPLVRAQLHEDIGGNYEKLGLYDAAEPHFRSALELRKRELGDVHELVAYSQHDLAALWIYQGNYAAAEPMLRQALALYRKLHGDECSHAADALCNLALVSNHNGDFAEAERLTREALAVRRTRFGDQHPDVALSMAELASALAKRDDSAAAEPLYREALTIARSAPGDQSSLIARILNDMAVMIWTRDAAEAERLLREALAMKRALVGDEHPGVALTLHDLGLLLLEKRDYAAAETPLREVLAIRRKLFGDHHPNVALDLGTLAELLRQQRDYAGAAPLFREALAILRLSDDLPNLAWTLHHLADCLRATGVLEEAEKLARHALDTYRANVHTWPGQRGEHRHATDVLSQTLVDAGKPDDAIVVRREFVEDVRRVLPVEDLSFASDLGRLGLLLLQPNRYAEAEPILRECLEIRDKALKPESLDYWLLANTRSMLGGALAEQAAALINSDAPAAAAKFTEAEGLLVDAGEWLTQNADRIPQQYRAERLREALERAVKLYESLDAVAPGTGEAEQAAKWRAKLENLPRP